MSAFGLKIKVPKESLIKLNQLQHQELVVKFNGGREVRGKLMSWDKNMNLVLNNTLELLEVEGKEESTRELGLIIVKGSQIHSICLKDGYLLIDNPYQQALLEAAEHSDEEAPQTEQDKTTKEKDQDPSLEVTKGKHWRSAVEGAQQVNDTKVVDNKTTK